MTTGDDARGPGFHDHFSEGAADYARYRPHYPDALFAAIAERSPARRLAWDCATGSGQAASSLANHFDRVVATDASVSQLERAVRAPRVDYAGMIAESRALARGSVDCVTVAQAAHWLEHEGFTRVVREVATPGALVVYWTYALPQVTPRVDASVAWLHDDLLGDAHWSPERKHVNELYRAIPFDFEEIAFPQLEMRAEWTGAEFLGYILTWSAIRSFRRARGDAPLDAWRRELQGAWGDDVRRPVTWPLGVRAGHVR